MKKKILIFDEIPIVSIALKVLINKEIPNASVVLCSNISDFFKLNKGNDFDLIIIDFHGEDKNDYLIIKKTTRNSKAKILIYSFTEDILFMQKCLRMGVNGILNRNCNELEFIKSINTILNGKSYVQSDIKVKLKKNRKEIQNQFSPSKIDMLSARELEVANLFVKGVSTSEICTQLNLAMTTVSTYKKRIFLKTETDNVIDLVLLFKNKVI
jgi:two-component system, NarL family, invasion response regulator UvrY